MVNEPPLRMRGHAKDGHPESPQVVLGLATSRTGAVLAYEVMAGNTSDKSATLPLVRSVRAALPGRPLLAVMDAGMASHAHLCSLNDDRAGWLAGLGVRRNRLASHAIGDPAPLGRAPADDAPQPNAEGQDLGDEAGRRAGAAARGAVGA